MLERGLEISWWQKSSFSQTQMNEVNRTLQILLKIKFATLSLFSPTVPYAIISINFTVTRSITLIRTQKRLNSRENITILIKARFNLLSAGIFKGFILILSESYNKSSQKKNSKDKLKNRKKGREENGRDIMK